MDIEMQKLKKIAERLTEKIDNDDGKTYRRSCEEFKSYPSDAERLEKYKNAFSNYCRKCNKGMPIDQAMFCDVYNTRKHTMCIIKKIYNEFNKKL
jgi:dethiobiotin synthetase